MIFYFHRGNDPIWSYFHIFSSFSGGEKPPSYFPFNHSIRLMLDRLSTDGRSETSMMDRLSAREWLRMPESPSMDSYFFRNGRLFLGSKKPCFLFTCYEDDGKCEGWSYFHQSTHLGSGAYLLDRYRTLGLPEEATKAQVQGCWLCQNSNLKARWRISRLIELACTFTKDAFVSCLETFVNTHQQIEYIHSYSQNLAYLAMVQVVQEWFVRATSHFLQVTALPRQVTKAASRLRRKYAQDEAWTALLFSHVGGWFASELAADLSRKGSRCRHEIHSVPCPKIESTNAVLVTCQMTTKRTHKCPWNDHRIWAPWSTQVSSDTSNKGFLATSGDGQPVDHDQVVERVGETQLASKPLRVSQLNKAAFE